jgi:hypothetical protein
LPAFSILQTETTRRALAGVDFPQVQSAWMIGDNPIADIQGANPRPARYPGPQIHPGVSRLPRLRLVDYLSRSVEPLFSR